MINGWPLRLLLASLAMLLLAWAVSPLWLCILISVLFYLLLTPLVSKLQAMGHSHDRAILYSLTPTLVLLIYATGYSVDALRNYLPQLAGDLEQLHNSAATALFNLQTHLESMIGVRLPLAEQAQLLNLNALLRTDRLLESTGVFANIAINLALVPPLAFFLLRDFQRWRDSALSLLPNDQFELGWVMYHGVSTRLQAYLRGLVWQALILAAITSVGFWIAGFPSPILLGLLTGIAGLVPYLGPVLAMVAPMIMLLSAPVFEPEAIFHIVAVLAIGFGFDNLVTIPFLLAGTVNLHPGIAMVAVVVAGHVGGIPAMILVIPVLGMLKIISQTLLYGLGPPVNLHQRR